MMIDSIDSNDALVDEPVLGEMQECTKRRQDTITVMEADRAINI